MKIFLSFILTVCVLFLTCFPVCSTNILFSSSIGEMITSETSTADEKNAINDILRFVSFEKDVVGLENADFSKLHIGRKIHRYNLTENGIEETNYSYPILFNGEVVLMATGTGDGKFQITTYEADMIRKHDLYSASFLYAADGMYVYDGEDFHHIHTYDETQSGKISLSDYLQSLSPSVMKASETFQSELMVSDFSLSESLQYVETASMNNSRSSGYYSATVDYVSQNGKNICWAACVAMLTNTLNGTNYTAEQIAISYLGTVNQENGLSCDKVAEVLRGESSVVNYYCDEDYMFYPDITIEDDYIVYCMQDYRPIFGAFIRPNNGSYSYHACIIDAIHTGSGYIRICDPNCGRIYGYRSTVESQPTYFKEYTFTDPVNNLFYYMHEQISTFHQDM